MRVDTYSKFLATDGGDIEIAASEDHYIIDSEGRRYIDFTSGWCVGNFGWSHAPIQKAIRNFKGPAYAPPPFRYKPWAELAAKLIALAPGKLQKCFRATGGTEAVEIALQAAMAHTGRRKFLSLEDAYHGNSIAAGSIGSYSRESFPNLLQNCHKISLPLDEAALGRVETQMKDLDVAAFIMEPVPLNLGVRAPELAFMEGLQKLCHRYGTLLIMDEVATGFGRTGKIFASEHFGIAPDIMCLAKGITGGYAPMGATLTTEEVAKSAMDAGGFYSTYGWHPLSTAAAIANLDYIVEHKDTLLAHIEAVGSLAENRLAVMFGMEHVRRLGLAIAVDAGGKNTAGRIKEAARKNGLLMATQEETLIMFPPLNIDHASMLAALDILETCVAQPARKAG